MVVAFAGAHGKANGLESILYAAKELLDLGRKDIHFVFVGEGSEKKSLIDFVEDRGYEAVEFQNEDYDPKEDTVSSLSKECGYFTVKDLPDVSEEL